MSDDITFKGQFVKAQTKEEGCMRITIDLFGMETLQCVYAVELAMKQAVIEFTPVVVSE